MKIYSILFLLIFLSLNSSFGQNPKLSVEFKVNKEYFVPYNHEINYVPINKSLKEKRFDVTISLKNNSIDTVKIWIMTCEWMRNFIINNEYISIYFEGCDSNHPHLVKINPHNNFVITGTLTRAITLDNPPKDGSIYVSSVKTTKIGFIYIDTQECKNFYDYNEIIEDKSRWNIIWSNSLKLVEIEEVRPKFIPPLKK